jgi:uncharacterized protein DUF4314
MSIIPEEGTRIRLIEMTDDPNPLPAGSLGTVRGGSDTIGRWTQIWVKWDSGRTLSLSIPPDRFEIVEG